MPTVAYGARTPDLVYVGDPLTFATTTYYWRIKFWSNTNIEGAWSSYATFGTHNSKVYQDNHYTYDANGNITKIVDSSDTKSAKTVNYTYDDLNRLTGATATNVASGTSTYTHTFTYDAIGNLTNKSDLGNYSYAGTNNANPHAATTINSVTNTYDNNGNLTSDGTKTITWNYKNQLIQSVGTIPHTTGAFPAQITADQTVTVSWSNLSNPSTTTWIGLYTSTETSHANYISWKYLGDCSTTIGPTAPASGSCIFTVANTGEYNFRLYSSSAVSVPSSTSNIVTVSSSTPTITMSAFPAQIISANDIVTVYWSSLSNPSTTTWIGLYTSTETSHANYISWKYLGDCSTTIGPTAPASGSCIFTVANTGEYNFRLYSSSAVSIPSSTSNILTVSSSTPTIGSKGNM